MAKNKKNRSKKKIKQEQTNDCCSIEVTTPEGEESSVKNLKLNANYFLFMMIIVVFLGCYKIIEPYLHTVILAVILAIIFNPLNRSLVNIFKGRENTAALVSCLLLTFAVVLPLLVMVLALIGQGIQSFDGIYTWVEAEKYRGILEHPWVVGGILKVEAFLPDVQRYFPNLSLQTLKIDKMLMDVISTIGRGLLNQSGQIAGNITSLVGKFFLMLFAFFFFVRDEEKIVDGILHLVPLTASQERRIFEKIRSVAKSAILGTFVTALAQGLAGAIAFWICGLPGLFWGMVMAFASLVPMVGTALIWIPAAMYLLVSGPWGYALFMVLWCVVVVGMIDNVVRPMFMQGGADMSTLLIFFAIMGGINYFGLIGLLYGPLIFGIAMVLLYIYSIEYEEFLNCQDEI